MMPSLISQIKVDIFAKKNFLQDRNKEFYYGTEIAIFQK